MIQVTGVLEIVRVRSHGVGVVPYDERNEGGGVPGGGGRVEGGGGGVDGVGIAGRTLARVELLGLVELEEKVRRLEDFAVQVGRVGVDHDQVGERVVLQLGQEVHSGGAV